MHRRIVVVGNPPAPGGQGAAIQRTRLSAMWKVGRPLVNLLLPVMAALGPGGVLACSPVKSIAVTFYPNSSVVPADQVLKLADWMAGLEERYPNHESIDVGASVEPWERDHRPDGLGLARGRNVARVLKENLQSKARIDLPRRGYVVVPNSSAAGTSKSTRVLGVQLDFLPACPHECPCPMGDPLYQPRR